MVMEAGRLAKKGCWGGRKSSNIPFWSSVGSGYVELQVSWDIEKRSWKWDPRVGTKEQVGTGGGSWLEPWEWLHHPRMAFGVGQNNEIFGRASISGGSKEERPREKEQGRVVTECLPTRKWQGLKRETWFEWSVISDGLRKETEGGLKMALGEAY